ncbi:MAG: hypothetical protein UT61_C0067G0005 [Candidatus Woesebacteria bacterium GW2011_GWA1_39_8]|jgi:hypothetical protein|uniref:Uncharacterized protein n=1 Tax=Candidatus Woesebacteria bacterium GW2011_GWA1_39_8 TaxID=1618552 RepID=A0A0G0PHY5_9BACT|nr:MAG: hypothetical protein UT61_C0067G0005 [Candidatus Woesebacteria bacterium GW2011_GWA1_39_8]
MSIDRKTFITGLSFGLGVTAGAIVVDRLNDTDKPKTYIDAQIQSSVHTLEMLHEVNALNSNRIYPGSFLNWPYGQSLVATDGQEKPLLVLPKPLLSSVSLIRISGENLAEQLRLVYMHGEFNNFGNSGAEVSRPQIMSTNLAKANTLDDLPRGFYDSGYYEPIGYTFGGIFFDVVSEHHPLMTSDSDKALSLSIKLTDPSGLISVTELEQLPIIPNTKIFKDEKNGIFGDWAKDTATIPIKSNTLTYDENALWGGITNVKNNAKHEQLQYKYYIL